MTHTPHTIDKIIQKVSEIEPNPDQTARGTTDAMSGEYIERIRGIIDKYGYLRGKYYIQVLTRRDTPSSQVLHTTFISRMSMPEPKWTETLYEVDNSTSTSYLVWCLPAKAEGLQVVVRTDLFDKKLIADCERMIKSGTEGYMNWSRERYKI